MIAVDMNDRRGRVTDGDGDGDGDGDLMEMAAGQGRAGQGRAVYVLRINTYDHNDTSSIKHNRGSGETNYSGNNNNEQRNV